MRDESASAKGRPPPGSRELSRRPEADEFEIGSLGIQHGNAWRWGIDTVIPMRRL
jgi:hypothetical protein